MRYALLVCCDENAEISAAERSWRAAGFASVPARLRAHAELAGELRLEPASSAVTVRCWDGGDVMVTSGPVTAARDQLTACYLVECSSLDAAIDLAVRIPAAWYGTVEVRQVQNVSGQIDTVDRLALAAG